MDAMTVGAVAALTGVSVRTLHHYDHIGLVVPSVRTPAGYRGYTDADIERLHLVLVYRAVDMSLEDIRVLLDGDGDVLDHLRRQHGLLLDRADRLQHMIKAVEELMSGHRNGIQLTAEEQVEIFGSAAFDDNVEESEDRWGGTDAWIQSQQRTARMTKQDWIEFKADSDALLAALAQAHRDAVAPGTQRANELAAWHRANIERFYDCDHEMQVGLAKMYLADERFKHYYDDAAPGLAQFVHDIIVANADR